ncbi:MAG: aminotransferase class V-fold PLP-dependent enzyme [Alphaproteobacteria bacterium]|nr:aminotransferase class V-fold PLP-dependent enzyme [Alphaproteobacteria bacterium]
MIDLDFVRRQFPAFATASLDGQSFFENAGGSYMCQPVIDRFNRYFVQRKVQPYYAFAASQEAGAEMDLAPVRFARYLNVDADEVLFGPSTSQNTYVLARACLERLAPGEAIIVSAQEHEANSGVWRKLADYGIDIRIWPVDPRDGRLQLDDLLSLLDNKVRLVAVTHCSNLVGEINPVRAIADATHQAGGLLLVDGVSYCPHGFPDVDALGADIYLFSTYKTYGPHQGVMVIRHAARALLVPQAHFFNHDNPMKWMVPAGPDHAQMAAANGVIDYFDALDAHHGGQDDKDRPSRVAALFNNAETPYIKTLLDYIGSRNDVRLIGPDDPARRAATISFVVPHLSAGAIGQRLADRGIMAGAGHYYAARLFSQMGLDPAAGAVRLSFVHYTSSADMTKLITALDEIL